MSSTPSAVRCIKRICNRPRVATLGQGTHCDLCWRATQQRRKSRENLPPTPKKLKWSAPTKPVQAPITLSRSIGAPDRAFLASLRVDDDANLTSGKSNAWRVGKGPARG